MKLVIVGGHLSPALAVLEALGSQTSFSKDTKILFIGRKYALEGDNALSLEYKIITKRKIPFAEISTGRLQRIFTRHTIPSLLKMPYGFIQSFFILQKFKPDVVLSFGGYLSVPVGLAAFILRIPVVIHEQTLEAGIANKILSIFAKKICISWESSRKFFPESKTVLAGNPIRDFQLSLRGEILRSAQDRLRNLQQQEIATLLSVARNDIPVIYITGGSAGSHFINTLVEGCIKKLLEKFIIVHQTGDAQKYHDFDRLQKLRESLPFELKERYRLTKFVEPENVGLVIKMADLVVSRAGINTVSELLFFKKPSLLIPISFSQRNEQVKNALFLKSLGLAEVLYQETLDSRKFLRYLEEMFNNIVKYSQQTEGFWTSPSAVSSGPNCQNDDGEAAKKIIEVIEYAKKTDKDKIR